MTIAAILRGKGNEVVSLGPDVSVADAVALLAAHGIGAVPVMQGDTVVGIFSERDVIQCLASEGAAALDKPVSAAMTAPVESIRPGDPAIGALSLMTQRRIRHLPVVEHDKMIGFISIGDIVKYRIDRIEADAAAMREYIQSA
ncbi:MAG TPA: CBS domain-containing protein [Sphingomonas sp.]|nr:CBS domain-containing protein [Sphingomonas sp.]